MYYAGIRIASSASCRHTRLMNAKAQFEATLRSLINNPCIQLMSYVGKWFAVFFIIFITWIWCNIWTLYMKYLQYCSITYFGSLRHTLSALDRWNIHVYTYTQFYNTTRTSTASITATFVTCCNILRKTQT
jgi:hypothetical protein